MKDGAVPRLVGYKVNIDLRPVLSRDSGDVNGQLVVYEVSIGPAGQSSIKLILDRLSEPLRNEVFFRFAMALATDCAIPKGDQLMAVAAELGWVFVAFASANGAVGMVFQRHFIAPRRPASRQ
jgi:hypothetical protein